MAEILLVSLCIGFLLIEVFFTHDRGYHIHSYNTFFPMWYASALAFYIGDFRYHSRYSHFENTPSGGDFVNETFKIIYQGN